MSELYLLSFGFVAALDLSALMGSCVQLFQGLARGDAGLVLGMVLAGLFGGVVHCTLMCGPFVLSQIDKQPIARGGISSKSSQWRRAVLPYHFGRITTYVAMAVVFSTILNLAFLFLPIRGLVIAPILVLAGLVFLVTAFPSLLSIFPWVLAVQNYLMRPLMRFGATNVWLKKALAFLRYSPHVFARYLMGVLLGFMPCGMVFSALLAASTASQPLFAGLAMLGFGVGTMPSLILLGLGGAAMSRKYPTIMRVMPRVMMVWSALWLFVLAGFAMA